MSELMKFEPTPEQFGVLWKYISNPNVTDVDYNGSKLWITDFKKGRYEAEETLTEQFINSFTHVIANCVNKQFNNANKVLEADTKELRISIIHNSAAASGISICIRKSPCVIRNTMKGMIEENYCSKEILSLLINCVSAKMNFVFCGEPGCGKTECAKFFMQFIPKEERVITIEDSLEIHYPEINPGADAVELRIGAGFSYTDAIKACLRQNPKWLVLSEARSVEVTSLLEQWSTGVNGFTTIHLDDLRKLPDRIQNMMDSTFDADRMENRIYRYVNVGILIRRVEEADGRMWRYIDQLCFYSRENQKNRIYMIVKDGEVISKELPEGIRKKMKYVGIEDPFCCCNFAKYIQEGK
ncbi:MAG: ATPase, T2SS/T4P/T4SS family [Clostridiales bacterium]|nr:CpaF/VirB11 family protein [Roseburia sp.]MDD7635412.1 ATPase, T2SS/T4P/T4SS family [Clostridiales bacterium]MDY4113947.1 ATPase, T2SS/T4P/T4SS family [Roseburia sp.]